MWVADQFYEILGTRFRVVFEDPTPAEYLGTMLAPFLLSERGARTVNTFCLAGGLEQDERGLGRDLYWDMRWLAWDETWQPLVNRVLQEINRRAVGGYQEFAAHAGVVGMADKVLALVAESGGGKSTLTAACLQAGFGYGSDESLCLRYHDAAVEIYPRPLGLSRWSREVLSIGHGTGFEGEAPVSAAALGAENLPGGRQLTDVVLLNVVEDSAPVLETLPRSRAIAELLAHSFNHFKNPAGAFDLVNRVARNVDVWKLTFSDPAAAAAELRASVETR